VGVLVGVCWEGGTGWDGGWGGKRREREMEAYIEKELLRLALIVLLLEIDVADGVDDEDLAVLGDDALLGAGDAGWRIDRRRRLCLRRLGLLLGLLIFRVLLLHPALAPIHRLHGLCIAISRGRRVIARSPSRRTIQAGNDEVVAPRRMARELDVAADELLLPLPAHVQRDVVARAADEDEQAQQHRAEPRPEARIVIARALPLREAVREEVVVPRPAGALEHLLDELDARPAVAGGLVRRLDLGLARALGDVDAGLVALGGLARGFGRDEAALHLVRVHGAGFLLQGRLQVVLVRVARDAEEVVEGDIGALGGFDLVAQTEDLVVWGGGGGGGRLLV